MSVMMNAGFKSAQDKIWNVVYVEALCKNK